MNSGGANGSSPTSSVGGPSAASFSSAARCSRLSFGMPATSASSSSAYGLAAPCSPARTISMPARSWRSSSSPSSTGASAANSSRAGR